jgi:hypothetical protein
MEVESVLRGKKAKLTHMEEETTGGRIGVSDFMPAENCRRRQTHVADTPGDCAFLARDGPLVGLALNA